MRRIILLLFLSTTTRPMASFAQHAFDDLPIDDPSRRSVLLPNENPVKKIRDNIFVMATVDHPNCYAGQQVELTYRLYTALQSTSTVTAAPHFDGFIAKERKVDETRLRVKVIDGRSYRAFAVWKVLLMPLQAGDYTLDAVTLNNVVSYTMADGRSAQYSAPVTSNKAHIHVKPLPVTGQPPAFTGPVGKWNIQSHLASPRLRVGDYDTLWVEIAGAGSFDNIPAPLLRWPAGFRHVESIERWQVNDNTVPESGRKWIAIPFTADKPGQYGLPPIPFAWFDPVTRQYHITHTDSLAVEVLR